MKKQNMVEIISSEVYEALSKKARQRRQSLRSYINEVFEDKVKTEDSFAALFPNLEITRIKDNVAYVADYNTLRISQVTANNDGTKLTCNTCEKHLICTHITFTIGSPKFWQVVEKND